MLNLILQTTALLLPITLLVVFLGFRWFGKLYSNRFNELASIMNEAIAKQQAELAAFKGMFMKEILTHDRIFDELVNLDNLNESNEGEFISDEYEKASE